MQNIFHFPYICLYYAWGPNAAHYEQLRNDAEVAAQLVLEISRSTCSPIDRGLR